MINIGKLIFALVQETKKYFLVLCVAAVLASFSPFVERANMPAVGGAFTQAATAFPMASDKPILKPVRDSGAPDLQFSAQAVLVKDKMSGEVLYSLESQKPVPVASLTKLMTAVVAVEEVGLDDVVTIEERDTKVSPDRADLVAGEKITVRNLIKAMLISSANDATLALARYAAGEIPDFVAAMNSKAGELKMFSTSFANPLGFDDPELFSSAEDMARLVEEFMNYPELVAIAGIRQTTVRSADGQYQHFLQTTNKLLLQHDEIVGLKTGYTSGARGNLIILVSEPNPWYSIVLGSEDREGDTEKIFNWVKESYVWR